METAYKTEISNGTLVFNATSFLAYLPDELKKVLKDTFPGYSLPEIIWAAATSPALGAADLLTLEDETFQACARAYALESLILCYFEDRDEITVQKFWDEVEFWLSFPD